MAYKDPDKQKQAVRQAVRRHRIKVGITSGITATDPAVQAIWDRRNAQGQAAGYSAVASSEDYPQTQRPMR